MIYVYIVIEGWQCEREIYTCKSITFSSKQKWIILYNNNFDTINYIDKCFGKLNSFEGGAPRFHVSIFVDAHVDVDFVFLNATICIF